MATVQNLEICKQCGEESAVNLFYTRTWEKHIFCTYCGFSYDFYIERDDEGNAIMIDERTPKFNSKTSEGYGVAQFYSNANSSGNIVPLDDHSKETLQMFLEELNKPDYKNESSYLTVFRDGNLEFLVGNKQEPLYL